MKFGASEAPCLASAGARLHRRGRCGYQEFLSHSGTSVALVHAAQENAGRVVSVG